MNTTTTTTTTTTMSTTTTGPSEWFQQFYQPSSEATTTTHLGFDHSFLASSISPTSPTTTITTTTPTPTGSSLLSPVQDGRISKPARRRTRASTKNPTTLLNTDTTNFRAMVQRYTGGATTYSPPFDSPNGFINIAGGLHLGQNRNFNQQPGSGLLGLHNYPSSSASHGGVELQAHQLHHQLLQQHGAAAISSSTANMNAGSAATRAVGNRTIGLGGEEEGASSRTGPGSGHYSPSSVGGDGGGGDNTRGGGFTY